MEDLNIVETIEVNTSKRKESCAFCGKDFEHEQVVLKFIEYVKEECYYEDDYYDDYENLFCSKECMIEHIIKYSENFKFAKIKEFNPKSVENKDMIRGFEMMLEHLSVNQTMNLHGMDIYCFEKDGKLKYLMNDSYKRTLAELKSHVIRNLKSKGIIY